MADRHEEALLRLCFVCGESVLKDTSYNVGDCKEMIKSGFNVDVEHEEGVSPKKLCNTCHRVASSMSSGEYMKTSRQVVRWLPHQSENCTTCETLGRIKVGGRKRKKKNCGGRPRADKVWCESNIPASPEVEYPFLYDGSFDVSQLKFFNTSWASTLCVICDKVMKGPICFKNCNHGSCRSCFLKENFKVEMESMSCHRCLTPIGMNGLKSGELIQSIVDNLRVICSSCNTLVPSVDYLVHAKRCGDKVTIRSLTSLGSADEVPKEAHEILENVSRVLLAQSNDNKIQIKTGGNVVLDTY